MASLASQLSSRRLARAEARADRHGHNELKATVLRLIDDDERFAVRLDAFITEYRRETATPPAASTATAEELTLAEDPEAEAAKSASVPQHAPGEAATPVEAAAVVAAPTPASAMAAAHEPVIIDLARYTEPTSIWEALMTGHVRLVKMSWLIAAAEEKRILARRQELPDEAFISVEELKRMYGDGNKDGVLPIIAISFCWLTPSHPDPEGKQLATVAAMMQKEQAKYAQAKDSFKGFSDMAVFWDWLSIYQKDPKLWTPACMKADKDLSTIEKEEKQKYELSRTEAEIEGFRYALHQTMDLWYSHQGTTVYMLTKLPEGSERKIGYSDSGWTSYEQRSAEQIKKVYLFDAKWKLVLDLGVSEGEDAAKQRNWPVGPDDFDVLIETKTFTNGADKEAVKKLFRKMSVNQLGGIKMLDFEGIAPPTEEDGQKLCSCLNLCASLEKLDLSSVEMSDAACKAVFSTLSNGALPNLETLQLWGNAIGDDGMKALAEACAMGAVPALKELYIDSRSDELTACCFTKGIEINPEYY